MWSYKINKKFVNIKPCEQRQQLQVFATLIAITRIYNRKTTYIETQHAVTDLKLYD
jgi:hypothetical protein